MSLPVIPTGAIASGDTYTIPISVALSSLQFGVDYDQVTRHIPSEGHKSWCNDPRYNQFENIEYLRGYQLYALRDCTLTITGTLPQTQASLPLEPGHNLIGVGAVSDGDTPAKLFKNISYTALKTLDSSGNLISVSNTTALVAGKAYYITLTSNSTYYSSTLFGETTFTYDGDGGRIKRITPNDETIFIGSLYEVNTNSDGTKKTKHIFLGDTRICSVSVGARFIEPEYSYFHGDHLGSTSDITDKTGTLTQHTEYLPYGETYIMSVGAASGGESASEYLYTGKLLDSSTGLYYYSSRYYDPEIGRFTQADTIVPRPYDPQSFNRYSYCSNNPINYVDPTGHSDWDKIKEWFGDIVGAIVGAITFAVSGQISLAMAAYSFVSGTINTYMSGYNIGESIGIGILAGSAGYLGGAIGGGLGGMGKLGGAILGGALGGAAGGATYAGLTGGNVGRAALAGAAGGSIAGLGGYMGGIFAPAGVLAGGGVGSEIMGGEFSQGVMRSIVAAAGTAIATGNFQGAKDSARAKAGAEGDVMLVQEEASLILVAGSADNPDPGWAAGNILKPLQDMKDIKFQITAFKDLYAFTVTMSEKIPIGHTGYFDLYFDKFTGTLTFYATPYEHIIYNVENYIKIPMYPVEGTKPTGTMWVPQLCAA